MALRLRPTLAQVNISVGNVSFQEPLILPPTIRVGAFKEGGIKEEENEEVSQGGEYGNALQAAPVEGHEEVVARQRCRRQRVKWTLRRLRGGERYQPGSKRRVMKLETQENAWWNQ